MWETGNIISFSSKCQSFWCVSEWFVIESGSESGGDWANSEAVEIEIEFEQLKMYESKVWEVKLVSR